VMIAPVSSPMVAMALIHVGMSPQAGGKLSRRQMYGHQVLREAGPRERTE
jgi:hypothetical protein